MSKTSLICDQCGGSVELDNSHEFGYCIFCKAKMLIKSDTIVNEVTQNITKHVYGHEGKDIDELVAEGNRLLELGDDINANAKFNNAINVDPNSWGAWLGYAATGGSRADDFSCIPAYKNTYKVAGDENQKFATFSDVLRHLPDSSLGEALLSVYRSSPSNKQNEVFNRTADVIGCESSEIAALVIDLCPNDWRAWFSQAKIRQPRVRWCELEGSLLTGRKLPKDALNVLSVFIRAYQLAKNESNEAKNAVLAHIATMENDDTYKNFYRELKSQIKREG